MPLSARRHRIERRLIVLTLALALAACAPVALTPTQAPVTPGATVIPAAAKPPSPTAVSSPVVGDAHRPCSAAGLISQLQAAAVTPSAAVTKPVAIGAAATPTPRPALADDRVGFPEGYEQAFKLLVVLDRPDNKQVRVICGNDAAASAVPGQSYPYGSILVMETYRAKQDAAGTVVKDANGRFIREALIGIFVQRKEPGFGVAYQSDRSGEWEYVGYRPDKSFLTAPRNTNACAACHLNQAGPGQDYVFRNGLFGDGRPAAPAPAANEVIVALYAFHPATLTIKAGTKVTWVNDDEAEHTISARDNAFTSEVLKSRAVKPGESFSHTFAQPGRYEYICSVHPSMVARIEVTP